MNEDVFVEPESLVRKDRSLLVAFIVLFIVVALFVLSFYAGWYMNEAKIMKGCNEFISENYVDDPDFNPYVLPFNITPEGGLIG